jgi:hypothetical protein
MRLHRPGIFIDSRSSVSGLEVAVLLTARGVSVSLGSNAPLLPQGRSSRLTGADPRIQGRYSAHLGTVARERHTEKDASLSLDLREQGLFCKLLKFMY